MAWLLYLLLAWAEVNASSLEKRIHGGLECKRDFHVRLTKDMLGKEYLCGGSLLTDWWVLTAAHCWDKDVTALHAKTATSSVFQKVTIKKVLDGHDIMLVRLSAAVKDKPVPLPVCKAKPAIGATVQVGGYGLTEVKDNIATGNPSTTLQCADMQVAVCKDPYKGYRFCAQSPPGKRVDTCPGDSGGGVIHNGQIYGVHSASGKKVCSTTAQFMDVCKYQDWIKKNVDGLKWA